MDQEPPPQCRILHWECGDSLPSGIRMDRDLAPGVTPYSTTGVGEKNSTEHLHGKNLHLWQFAVPCTCLPNHINVSWRERSFLTQRLVPFFQNQAGKIVTAMHVETRMS